MNTLSFLWCMIIAHILADFPCQTDGMVASKSYVSKAMWLHIGIVVVLTALATLDVVLGLCVGVLHYLIDVGKLAVMHRKWANKYGSQVFMADQVAHILALVGLFWVYPHVQYELNGVPQAQVEHWEKVAIAVLFCMYPASYVVKLSIEQLLPSGQAYDSSRVLDIAKESDLQRAGRLIGRVERVLILVLVLINQYEAIGFLITGKSIIRFADKNSKAQSEYVIVGTLLSYLLALVAGLWANA